MSDQLISYYNNFYSQNQHPFGSAPSEILPPVLKYAAAGQALDCGRFVYVLQRTCEGVHFPLLKFYDILNAVEGQHELWGGCDIIGGSPRALGSRIPPEKLAEILNSVMVMSTSGASIGLF